MYEFVRTAPLRSTRQDTLITESGRFIVSSGTRLESTEQSSIRLWTDREIFRIWSNFGESKALPCYTVNIEYGWC